MGCSRGGNSSTEPYIAAHNIILAHAAVYRLYEKKYQVTKPCVIYMYTHIYIQYCSYCLYYSAYIGRLISDYIQLINYITGIMEENKKKKIDEIFIVLQEKQGGKIGIALNINYYEPYDTESIEDKEAANRLLDFNLGWFVKSNLLRFL